MLSFWKIIETKYKKDFKIFKVELETKVNSSSKEKADFVKINSANWVNIIPITKDNRVVLIKQFRQGVNDFILEIPGGIIEETEEPAESAIRECKEETGYNSKLKPILLGEFLPNPAFQNNKLYSFLWKDCEKTDYVNFDKHEEIETKLYSFSEVNQLIMEGKINHSLVLNAFYLLEKNNINGK